MGQPNMNQVQPNMNQVQPNMNPNQVQPNMNPNQVQPMMNANQVQPNMNPVHTQAQASAQNHEQAQKLFVGGVCRDTTPQAFNDFFRSYGPMTDCILMIRDGRSRCFGFVTYRDASSMNQVLCSTLDLDGKVLDVKIAVPEEKIAEKGAHACKVHVGSLPHELTQEEFKTYFSQFGEVMDAFIVKEKETQESRGFGFVIFKSEREVHKVLSNPHHSICGKEITCNKARPPQRDHHGGRRGYDDYYNYYGRPPYSRRQHFNNSYGRDYNYYAGRRRYHGRQSSRYYPYEYDYGGGYGRRGYGPPRGRNGGYRRGYRR